MNENWSLSCQISVRKVQMRSAISNFEYKFRKMFSKDYKIGKLVQRMRDGIYSTAWGGEKFFYIISNDFDIFLRIW